MATSNWPAIGNESHRWVHRDPMASHRARIRNTGDFAATVVPRIFVERAGRRTFGS